MKRIPLNLFKTLIGSSLILLIIFITAIFFHSQKSTKKIKTKGTDIVYTPAPYTFQAPKIEYKNLDDKGEWTYAVQADGIKIKNDGKNYVVQADGIKWIENPNGSYSAVVNPNENALLNRATIEVLNKENPLGFATASFLDGVDPRTLSDSQIEELINGLPISVDDFKRLANEGKTLDEILNGAGKDTADQTSLLLDDEVKNKPSISDKRLKNTAPTPASSSPILQNEKKEIKRATETNYAPYPSMENKGLEAALKGLSFSNDSYKQVNGQEDKKDFMSSFANNNGSQWLSENNVAPGTVIPIILISGINTDLPGQIIAQVKENVYDSLTGENLLIPKGTKVMATYDSSITFGQRRILIAWTTLVRPDGFLLNMPGLPGTDRMGYAGQGGNVNNHLWEIIGSALLASVIDLGANMSKEIYNENETAQTAINSFVDTTSEVGQKYVDKWINRAPTITVAPGTETTIMVTQVLTLENIKEKENSYEYI